MWYLYPYFSHLKYLYLSSGSWKPGFLRSVRRKPYTAKRVTTFLFNRFARPRSLFFIAPKAKESSSVSANLFFQLSRFRFFGDDMGLWTIMARSRLRDARRYFGLLCVVSMLFRRNKLGHNLIVRDSPPNDVYPIEDTLRSYKLRSDEAVWLLK